MKTKVSNLASLFHHNLKSKSHYFHRSLPYFCSIFIQESRTQVHESHNHHFSKIPLSKIHTKSTPNQENIQNNEPNDDKPKKVSYFSEVTSSPQFFEPNLTLQQEPEDSVDIWLKMKDEAKNDLAKEPILSKYYVSTILSHDTIESALSNLISMKLSTISLPSATLHELIMDVLIEDQEIVKSVKLDLKAVKERDPACSSYVHCFLHFKGFIACQAHRIAHKLWLDDRKILALLIQNQVSEVFALDIHPGAKIGSGILLDHATGVVIGETAVIGDNVSILHNVTLGGTGKSDGDRHPKIGDGVLIGAGTCVLGNIRIGNGAKIGAGSVVVKDVPDRTTAVGNPAKLIGGKDNPVKHDKIPSHTMDHLEFYDYVI